MAKMFRRISKRSGGLPNKVFSSIDNLVNETSATEGTANKLRARSESCPRFEIEAITNNSFSRRIAWRDGETSEDHNNALTMEWMEKWKVPPLHPFGRPEFKHRVETVKSAILVEMDKGLARDMRSYNLVDRRPAICKEMISPQLEKPACLLGILGC